MIEIPVSFLFPICPSLSSRIFTFSFYLLSHVLNKSKLFATDTKTPGADFSKAPETFRARKAIEKSQTLRLHSCFIHIFLI